MKRVVHSSKFRFYATSLTTTLFFVVGLSGVFIYFHLFDGYLKSLHEVFGLGFFVVVIGHTIAHFRSIKNYFNNRVFLVLSVITLLFSSVYIYNNSVGGENPKIVLIKKSLNGPLEITLGLFGDRDTLVAKLAKNDIEIGSGKTLLEVAKINGVSPFKIVEILNEN